MTYSSFDLSKFDNETLSEAGVVSREEAFERAAYWLERVIPVAEENKVQMACHLNDPPAPVLRGVERWNWPVMEGLKRFSELVDSPYHGFNFCCGVASEGLENPAEELCDIVRYFGERGQAVQHPTTATSRAGCTIFKRSGPTKAMSICTRWRAPCGTSATNTC